MEDRKVVYIYTLWFNPHNSNYYGDLCCSFFKESAIAILKDDGAYYIPDKCDEYRIFEDGSNRYMLDIDEEAENIQYTEVSFDNTIMEEFKVRATRSILNSLWNKYVRKNNDE